MSEKTREEEFYDLVPKAAKVHPWTWCVKKRMSIPTIAIMNFRCYSCSEFVLNGGVCDPV